MPILRVRVAILLAQIAILRVRVTILLVRMAILPFPEPTLKWVVASSQRVR
jgi:hypothetical protein